MKSFDEAFSYVKAYCQSQINKVVYDTWICCITPVSIDSELAILEVPSVFVKGIIENKYSDLLKEAFAAVLGFEIPIKFITPEDEIEYKETEEENQHMIFSGEYEYSFETFIVGNCNKLAHAAAQSVALNPTMAYNPLFIHGGSGLGKTHLLCAIRHEVKKTRPGCNIIYIKGEDFTNEIVESIRKNETAEFRRKYRSIDILLVDDIQFIAGKAGTQEEFFHTFEALFSSGKQIILASDRPPKEIKSLEDRLRTRFEWGLIVDMQPPDFETRLAILKRKADLMEVYIPDEVCYFICEKVKSNIRQIEGIVKKLKVLQETSATKKITLTIAQNALKDIMSDEQPVTITVDKIITEVARTFDVSPQDIRGTKRNASISSARQAAMYIIREITDMPMSSIGAEFSGRNHSTVVYSNNNYKTLIDNNPKVREITEDIIKNIKNL